MSSLKLEDVIHYYAFSNVYGEKNWGIAAIFHTPLEKPITAELTVELVRLIRLRDISFVPILRHLEDRTEMEETELRRLETSDETIYRAYKLVYSPLALNFLIAKGFDVFGLIESGQAIRKGVENV